MARSTSGQWAFAPSVAFTKSRFRFRGGAAPGIMLVMVAMLIGTTCDDTRLLSV